MNMRDYPTLHEDRN